jgi:hypothetical protein
MDDLIAGTGVAHRALLMSSFMDNMLRQVELIRTQGRRFLSFSSTSSSNIQVNRGRGSSPS